MSIRKTSVVAALGAGLLATLLPLTAAQAATTTVLGVALYENGTRLGRFNTTNPSGMTAIGGRIVGLDEDDFLIGIDRRVRNNRLYGVGNQGGIYMMSGDKATQVGQLSVALAGGSFGVDFNPAADALRIVSDEGQNLRVPFSSGNSASGTTFEDEPLNYDGEVAVGINSTAYTNNDRSDATGTTQFDINSNLDQVAVQSPPNSGNLFTAGDLGTGAGVSSGFDIYSEVSSGNTVSNQGFAAIPAGTAYRFHKVDLLTGAVTYVGRFPNRVTDIALDLDS